MRKGFLIASLLTIIFCIWISLSIYSDNLNAANKAIIGHSTEDGKKHQGYVYKLTARRLYAENGQKDGKITYIEVAEAAESCLTYIENDSECKDLLIRSSEDYRQWAGGAMKEKVPRMIEEKKYHEAWDAARDCTTFLPDDSECRDLLDQAAHYYGMVLGDKI